MNIRYLCEFVFMYFLISFFFNCCKLLYVYSHIVMHILCVKNIGTYTKKFDWNIISIILYYIISLTFSLCQVSILYYLNMALPWLTSSLSKTVTMCLTILYTGHLITCKYAAIRTSESRDWLTKMSNIFDLVMLQGNRLKHVQSLTI